MELMMRSLEMISPVKEFPPKNNLLGGINIKVGNRSELPALTVPILARVCKKKKIR
jgi:hypothetical protein